MRSELQTGCEGQGQTRFAQRRISSGGTFLAMSIQRTWEADHLTDHWWKGPDWLPEQQQWPRDATTKNQQRSREAEGKTIRQVLSLAVTRENPLDDLLEKFQFHKNMRFTAWIGDRRSKAQPESFVRIDKPLDWRRTNMVYTYTKAEYKEATQSTNCKMSCSCWSLEL